MFVLIPHCLSPSLNLLPALQAYSLMRDTGCLSDPTTNTFCYLNAVRNANPSDLYFYQLPLGIGLPNTSTPLCSACTRSIMGFYAHALKDSEQAKSLTELKTTYGPAASLAVKHCGASYAEIISNRAAASRPQSSLILALSTVVLLAWSMSLDSS